MSVQTSLHDDPLRVSVVCATYNGSRFLKETIDGLSNQTERNLEIVIVDDCSTDNTMDVLSSWSDSRVRLLRNNTNSNVVYSRNRAVDSSRGGYVAVTDQDDVSHPNRLKLQANLLGKVCTSHPRTDRGCDDR